MKNKKGYSLDTMGMAIIAFIVIGVVAVVGFLILTQLQNQTFSLGNVNLSDTKGPSSTGASNATYTVISSMTTLVNFLPIVAVVIAGVMVIGILGLMRGREGGI